MAAYIERPQEVVNRLSAEDHMYLSIFKELIYQKVKAKMGEIYRRLDTDGSNTLTADDFKHTNPQINLCLNSLWELIVFKFDFDGDREIEKKEFLEGLVLWAYQSEKYAQHQAQQAQQAQVGGTLGDEFFLSVEIFNSIIWDFLLEIEEQMNRLSAQASVILAGGIPAAPVPVAVHQPAAFLAAQGPYGFGMGYAGFGGFGPAGGGRGGRGWRGGGGRGWRGGGRGGGGGGGGDW